MSFEAQPIELPPFEIARLVVRLDPVASVIVNANQEIVWAFHCVCGWKVDCVSGTWGGDSMRQNAQRTAERVK